MGSEKILPKEGQRNILITSALPYVNNVSCLTSYTAFAKLTYFRSPIWETS